MYFLKAFKKYYRNKKAAVVAIEFMFFLPLTMLVLMAIIDYSRYFEYVRKVTNIASLSAHIVSSYNDFYVSNTQTAIDYYYGPLAQIMLRPFVTGSENNYNYCAIITVATKTRNDDLWQINRDVSPSGCQSRLGETRYPAAQTINGKQYIKGSLYPNLLPLDNQNEQMVITEVRARYKHFGNMIPYMKEYTKNIIPQFLEEDIYRMVVSYPRVDINVDKR